MHTPTKMHFSKHIVSSVYVISNTAFKVYTVVSRHPHCLFQCLKNGGVYLAIQ